jgi:hypothetical protein
MAYVPKPDELTKALEDVHYEIQQLAFTALLNTSEVGINNAILESKLLHIRNLLDFFELSPQRKDDVLAIHYGFAASRIPVAEEYRDRLDKDLAHLTYARTRRSGSNKIWPHESVVGPVLAECRSFAKHILTAQSGFDSSMKAMWDSLLLVLEGIIVVTPSPLPQSAP